MVSNKGAPPSTQKVKAATDQPPPAKQARISLPVPTHPQPPVPTQPQLHPFQVLLNREDIWTENILPFLGSSIHALVAPVSKRFQELNVLYVQNAKPCVVPLPDVTADMFLGAAGPSHEVPACSHHTSLRVAFSSLYHAQQWEQSIISEDGVRVQLPPLTPKQKHTIFALVIKAGNLDVVKWMQSKINYLFYDTIGKTCRHAAASGNLEILMWARTMGFPWNARTCTLAAHQGHLHVLRWARDNGCPWNEFTSSKAADGGHLHVLRYAHEMGCPFGVLACTCAAYRGHFDILKWLRSKGCPWEGQACAEAAYSGHLDILEWLLDNGCPSDEDLMGNAAHGGQLRVMKWLHQRGYTWDEKTCAFAAFGGQLGTLKWLRAKGCGWNEETFEDAAEHGDIKVLEWLKEEHCPWNERACSSAAREGNLEALKWLRAHKCPWDADTHRHARHYPEMLQWVLVNGCPTE